MDLSDSADARMGEGAAEESNRDTNGSHGVEYELNTEDHNAVTRDANKTKDGNGDKEIDEGDGDGDGDEGAVDADSSDSDSPPSPSSSPPPWYDSGEDEKDERWMAKERKRHGGGGSDAILSCPGCLSSICYECQRHDRYTNQYRAVFAVNCAVNTSQKLRTASGEGGGSKKRKGKGRRRAQEPKEDHRTAAAAAAAAAAEEGQVAEGESGEDAGEGDGGEVVHPVACETCGTEVGLFDTKQQVYHFFHVLPTNC